MSPEELERAIVAPADRAGLAVEPRLLAAMIADVVDRPGALPLLQYALTELAERREDGVLTLDGYRRIGGVSGALARRAEQLFEAMNERARDACRQLFLRLVTLGEGSEDTRRRVRRSELATARRRADDGRRDRDVRPASPALVRPRSRHARADRRDRARGAAPGVGAAARMDRRCPGGSAPAREDLVGNAGMDPCGPKLRLPPFGDPARAGRGGRRWRHGSPHGERTRVPRRERRPPGCRAWSPSGCATSESSRSSAAPARRLRGLVAVLAAALVLAASLTAVSIGRSREAEQRSDESTVAALTSALPLEPQHRPGDKCPPGAARCEPQCFDRRTRSERDGQGSPLGDARGRDRISGEGRRHGRLHQRVAQRETRRRAAWGEGVFDLPLSILATAARKRSRTRSRPSNVDASSGADMSTTSEDFPARPRRGPSGADPASGGPAAGRYPGHAVRRERSGTSGDLRRGVHVVHARQPGIDVRIVGNTFSATTWPRASPRATRRHRRRSPARAHPDLAREGHLIDLGTYLDLDALRNDQSPYLVSLGTVGDDGSWPASDGATYGAFVSINLKSLCGIRNRSSRTRATRIPTDVGRTHRAQRSPGSRRPDALGAWDGSRTTAIGWPGTDWIENLLLKGAGPRDLRPVDAPPDPVRQPAGA